MAKEKPQTEVNKSEEIRKLLRENPEIKAKEVVDTLAGRGIAVKPGLFYLIKGKMSVKKGRKKRGPREKVAAAADGSRSTNPVTLVLNIKKLAEEAGGMAKLKQLIEAIG